MWLKNSPQNKTFQIYAAYLRAICNNEVSFYVKVKWFWFVGQDSTF